MTIGDVTGPLGLLISLFNAWWAVAMTRRRLLVKARIDSIMPNDDSVGHLLTVRVRNRRKIPISLKRIAVDGKSEHGDYSGQSLELGINRELQILSEDEETSRAFALDTAIAKIDGIYVEDGSGRRWWARRITNRRLIP